MTPGFEPFAEILARLPWWKAAGSKVRFRCVFPERHKHGDRNPSAFLLVDDNGWLVASCSGCGARTAEIAQRVGLPRWHWGPPREFEGKRMSGPTPRPVETYPYTDRHGELLAAKVRFEPGFGGRPKSFLWRRPVPEKFRKRFGVPPRAEMTASGPDILAGGWVSPDPRYRTDNEWRFAPTTDRLDATACELEPLAIGLYRLPELAGFDPRASVVIVEGERKADRLAALGFCATTGPNGKGQWEPEWSAAFAGRRVVVVPDREPGAGDRSAREYADRVCGSALDRGAASVRRVVIPVEELKPDGSGGDIVDWLARHFPAADRASKYKAAAELFGRYPEYKRPKVS